MPGKIRKRPTPPEFIMRRVEDVPLHFLSNPEDPNSALVVENFTLEFKSYTAFGFMKLNDELQNETFVNREHMECEVKARSITAIIDSENQPLTDETGSPAKLTATFFLGLPEEDLKAIQEAISRDANPSQPPATPNATPGDSGKSPEANEA